MENKLLLLAIEKDEDKKRLLNKVIQVSSSSSYVLQYCESNQDIFSIISDKKPDLLLIDYFDKKTWGDVVSSIGNGGVFVPVILYSDKSGFPSDSVEKIPGIWEILSLTDSKAISVIIFNFLNLKQAGTFLLSEQAYSRVRRNYKDLIIENGGEGIIIVQNGVIKYSDPQVLVFLEKTEQEVYNSAFIDIIHPEDKRKAQEGYKKRLAGEKLTGKFLFRIISKTGKIIWVETIGYPIEWEGKPATFYFASQVSEKVNYEKAIRESEAKYRELFYTSPNGIVLFNREGIIIEVNPAISIITDYPEDYFLGKAINEISSLTEAARVEGMILMEDIFSGNRTVPDPISIIFTKIDGEKRFLKISLSIIVGNKGEEKLLVTCSDFTDHENAVSNLANSEKKFRELHEKMLESVIATDNDGNILEFNRAFVEITGYSEGDLLRENLFSMFPDNLAAEDEKRRNEVIQKRGFSDSFDMELITKMNTTIPVEVQSYLKDNGRNNPMGYWYFIKDVSSRKKYENQLIEREIQLQAILEYLPFPIIREDLSQVKVCLDNFKDEGITDFVGYFAKFPEKVIECCKKAKISYCNQSALQFFNVNDLKELEEFYVCSQKDEIAEARGRMMLEFLNFNVVFEEEVVFSVKNKIKKSAVFKSAILPGREDSWDTVLVALIDLTEISHLDSQVKVLLQAISHSPASIVITDTNGKIEYVNPKFTEVTGYSSEDAFGKDTSILKSGEMPQKVYDELWATITSGGEWVGELLNKDKAGNHYWELASISAVKNDEGEVTHFVAIKEDITEQKENEMKLRDAKQKAEESDGLKTAFLANMSHEIRTPMNAIVGFSELLRTSNVQGSERDEYFNIINTSCRTLSNLIDDIIDLAKIESGQTKIMEEACQPSKIMKELQLYFSEEVQKSGRSLRIVLDVDFHPALVTKTDEFRLRQVLTNLLGNSFKFTHEGLITWGAKITNNEELEFYVKDTGIGIDKEHLDSIFERFRQLDGSSVRKYEGTGLGLSVSKSLVELMGGHIWVNSEVGKGSEFKFTIPLRYMNDNVLTQEEKNSSYGKEIFDWKGYNILVVEDNVSNFEFIKAVLSKTNATILWAETGPSAIEMFRENENIHLILMDIQIPELDGYETTIEILKLNPDIPVIAQTAFAMSRDREKSLEAGCIDYISKPIKPLDLLNLMEKYIPEVK